MKINVEPDQVRQYLSKGKLTFYHAKGIIVGCGGAGKTTLMNRLMNPEFDVDETKSTNIVDVHVNAFSVKDETIQGKYDHRVNRNLDCILTTSTLSY